MREIRNRPVVEENHHLLPFGNTLGNGSKIGPKPVAGLSWCITDYSHK